ASVVNAPADGCTLLMSNMGSMATDITLRANMPYDPAEDLAPVGLIAGIPFVLVTNPDLPVETLEDFVAHAKENPGELSYSSVGLGSVHHLFIEYISSELGIEALHVPFSGGATAVTAVRS